MKNVGGKLKTLRLEKQLTLPELAEKAHLSKGIISKIENAEDANPSLETLYKLAEALDVSLYEILETEKAQAVRVVPDEPPDWQKALIADFTQNGREPDQDILNAMYMLRNRKAAKNADLETWKFLYRSIENSFKS